MSDLRRFSDPEKYGISVDADDQPDGSDGGYGAHGNYVIPEAMMELVQLRAENERLRERVEDLIMSRGRRTASQTVYMQAVIRHCDNATAKEIIKKADKAAAAVQRKDLVTARPASENGFPK